MFITAPSHPVSKLPLPLLKTQIWSVRKCELRVHRGKGRSDHLMGLCSTVIRSSPAVWPEIKPPGEKRQVEADRQGNPFSFLSMITGYSQQTLPVRWKGLVLQSRLHCLLLISHSFLCLSVHSYTYLSCLNQHTPSFSHTACKPGYFKPSVSSQLCQVCPDNTKPSAAGAIECQCEDGFFRSPTDPPTSACSGKNTR